MLEVVLECEIATSLSRMDSFGRCYNATVMLFSDGLSVGYSLKPSHNFKR